MGYGGRHHDVAGGNRVKGGVDVKRGSQGGVRGRGFTLVELLVALGMIALLSAAMTVAVSRAQLRAKVSKATQEIREMTNAILAFEQYARGRTLANHVNGGWVECSEGNMRMILGGETGENGTSSERRTFRKRGSCRSLAVNRGSGGAPGRVFRRSRRNGSRRR
jgi:prepilin-type N-terminal cleavage/methylation domain-containing protein